MDLLVTRKRESALQNAREGLFLCQQWDCMHLEQASSINLCQSIHSRVSRSCEDIQFVLHAETDQFSREVWSSILLLFRRVLVSIEAKCPQNDPNVSSAAASEPHNANILYPNENPVKWEDIIGNHKAKDKIAEVLLYPEYLNLVSPSRVNRNVKASDLPSPCRTVLLYGPPGTGKTMIVKAAAKSMHLPIYCITAADFLSKWLGESEKAVRCIFDALKREKRCIMFIDEVDSIFSTRASSSKNCESESERRIKTEFLICLQDLLDSPTFDGFFIAATNLPTELDLAFLRRFDVRIPVDLPCKLSRSEFLRARAPELSTKEIERLSQKLNGFNYADMQNIWRAARLRSVREHIRSIPSAPAELRSVNSGDIERAICEYSALCQGNNNCQ